jgi:D-alanine--D-alanine ligase
MAKTIVGVLRGGPSSEYNLSLKTGNAILDHLPQKQYDARDIFIDKKGVWHLRGIPMSPMRAISQVDVVFNGLHGGVGEDGTVGRLLQKAGIPYTGSRPLQSALSLNKIRARDLLQKSGIRMPRGVWFTLEDRATTGQMAKDVFAQFPGPYILKPPLEGSSYGIVICRDLASLPDAIGDALDHYGSVLVEEQILGREATVGLIEKFRKENLYALPPARILVPQGWRMIHPSHHEEGSLRHFAPSDFNDSQKNYLIDTARKAHQILGLDHFSQADFLVTPHKIYLLEVNALPGLYPGAAFPAMLESVGVSMGDFLHHAVQLARRS